MTDQAITAQLAAPRKDLLTIDNIASMMSLSPAYVRDKLVKRADFPRPSISLSQKFRRWSMQDVSAWLQNQQQQIAR